MHFSVVSIFPEMLKSFLQYGIVSRAIANNLLQVTGINPRDFASEPHRNIDDRPYGGGPGMLMQVAPMVAAINAAKQQLGGKNTCVIALSPQGSVIKQSDINSVVQSKKNIVLVAGRYEGFDQRIIDLAVDCEWSLGDYVLSGGEVAAMAVIDAVARCIPGVLGNEHSVANDSFQAGLLDYPQYSRPEEFSGLKVPKILLSGDHGKIAKWRMQQQLGKTWLQRSDLLASMELSEEQHKLLEEFIDNQQSKDN